MGRRATFTQAELSAFPARPIGMSEAAERLGISRRTLTDAIKNLPHFELRGRKKVFYPEHIEQLRQGMHRCACKSSGSADGPMLTAPALMASASGALSELKRLERQKKRGRT